MHNLVVLDYASGEVFFYKLNSTDEVTVEKFISEHHRIKDCEWMSTPDGGAIEINWEG